MCSSDLPENPTGNPDPNAVLDDDRPVQVNSITVNEASPYAVFQVSAAAGQRVTLSVQNDADPLTADAVLGTDTAAAATLQYFNGTGWVAYAGGAVALPGDGRLLVRLGLSNDALYEGAETFQLRALNSGGTGVSGTATIVDDGSGSVYPESPTGNPDPNAVLDDDRPVQVSSITVNEASPYAVFQVSAAADRKSTRLNSSHT